QCNVKNNDSKKEKYVIDGDIIYLNTALDVKYVGTESCRDCHEEIYNVYIESQTGRSMSRMNSSNIIEEFPQKESVYDSSRNFYYEMIRRNDRFYQREFRLDDDDNVVHERLEEAQYIIGSGKNLRMYFYQDNGMYYQLPLTWYVNENKWDMSPGYSEFINVRFSRYVSPMCFSCHNGHMELSSTANNRYNGQIHLGIGCEDCHGPGDLHVRQEYKEDINLPNENEVTIVNPTKLSPHRRIDVCQQCHLEGQSWALNGDNTWFDFRPGMLLKTHRSVYSPSNVTKKAFRVANSAYRLSLSRCFDGSHSSMTCDLCHDPHRMTTTRTVEYNRQNCQKCHSPQSLPGEKSRFAHSETDDCIPCHMKRTGTENTLHGVINTDHWIRVNADDDTINWKSLREISKDSPVITLVADINNEDDDSNIRKGMAYFEFWKDRFIITSYLDSALHYLTRGLKISPSNATGYYFLGKVLYFRKEFSDAVFALNKSIEFRPEHANSNFYLGQSYVELNDLDQAIKNFRKANELMPDDPEYLEKLGITLAKNDSTREAIITLEKALTKDKQNPYVYYTLGNLYAQSKNNPSKALPFFEKAVILDPDIPDGFLNLGNTYVLLTDFTQAIMSYKKAQLLNPQSPNALVNMGRVYTHLRQIEEARNAFNQALRISPGLDIARQLLNNLPDK
ncbi:tetratricopeptide repeat protein, partial [Bacteroidota bacterium]